MKKTKKQNQPGTLFYKSFLILSIAFLIHLATMAFVTFPLQADIDRALVDLTTDNTISIIHIEQQLDQIQQQINDREDYDKAIVDRKIDALRQELRMQLSTQDYELFLNTIPTDKLKKIYHEYENTTCLTFVPLDLISSHITAKDVFTFLFLKDDKYFKISLNASSGFFCDYDNSGPIDCKEMCNILKESGE